MSPFDLFTLIKRCLKDNGHYKHLVEEKKRCVRLNYKENFHLDILPARSDKENLSQTGILIPDKELRDVLSSDPKGYASWFWGKSTQAYRRMDTEIKALPQYQPAHQKNNLQCIVQLMKRHRDVFFEDHPEYSPPSIIITTLCGKYYKTLGSILDDMINIVDSIKRNPTKNIYNPINPQELLSEKWEKEPIIYNSFTKWVKSIHNDLELLKATKNIEKKLKEMFW